MHEKIILQDFTVLLICISQKWSTIERRVLFDAAFLRNSGCNSVILCEKGSQLDKVAEFEDIPRVYINTKVNFLLNLNVWKELNSLISEKRFDLIHCYSLKSARVAAFILKSHPKVPLIFTNNQLIKNYKHNFFNRWLLKRLDYVFTLSEELKDFSQEVLPIPRSKIKSLGGGLEVFKKKQSSEEVKNISCVIDNILELNKLKIIVKIFRVLKGSHENFKNLELCIFLGPRIYQKEKAKKVLTEFDYEFYEGDIKLYSLEGRDAELKSTDLFIGTAFHEPLNDYEIVALMNEIPVLFPRTAARQDLIFKFSWIGESYLNGDVREAKTKLAKIINNYQIYKNGLKDNSEKIQDFHGLDSYAQKLQLYYEKAFGKRHRSVIKN